MAKSTASKTRSKKKAAGQKKTKNKTPQKRKTYARAYEGASKSKRLSRWLAPSTSANSETQMGLVTLRDRARDLRRNNPYARRGIEAITSNVVGHGIQTQFRDNSDVDNLLPSETVENLELSWKNWAETTAIDFDGRNNIFGLQRLIMDAVVESGEVLVRKKYTYGLNFPLQYQVLESDFLDVNKNESVSNGNAILQGIEFNKKGKRVAYWLHESHPGSYDTLFGNTIESKRILAEDVIHIYRMDRPGQVRGISWLAPILVRVKDLDEFEDAQLVRQKVSACFTAFVRDISIDSADEEFSSEDYDMMERMEPGIIEHLPSGKQIEFSNPPELQNYQQYVTQVLRAIGAGLGITYEVLANDYSNVNFSSGRMGWIEMFRNIKLWQENVMSLQFMDVVAKDFLQVWDILGEDVEQIGWLHITPKREMIDPTKEIPAAILAIRGGLSNLSDELMALGKDPVEHLKQYKKDLVFLDSLGLKLQSDPRVAAEGGPEEKITEEEKGAKNAA